MAEWAIMISRPDDDEPGLVVPLSIVSAETQDEAVENALSLSPRMKESGNYWVQVGRLETFHVFAMREVTVRAKRVGGDRASEENDET